MGRLFVIQEIDFLKVRSKVADYLAGGDSVEFVGPFADLPMTQFAHLFVDNKTRKIQGLSLGDGDSSTEAMDIPLPKEKNFSDFEVALLSLPKSVNQVVLSGFLGGRRDHEWINMMVAVNWARKTGGHICFDDRVYVFSSRTTMDFHGGFSLMSFETQKVDIEGQVKYALNQVELPMLSSMGLSNMAHGEFEVVPSSVVVLARYDG